MNLDSILTPAVIAILNNNRPPLKKLNLLFNAWIPPAAARCVIAGTTKQSLNEYSKAAIHKLSIK